MLTFALLLLSSLIHATWNYLSKTIKSGIPFIWLTAIVTTILYFPVVLYFVQSVDIQWTITVIVSLAGTVIIHLVYFMVLQKGYQVSDLSVVYPIARGTGPLLSSIGAILFFQEKISWAGSIGLFFVVIGVLFIADFFNKKDKIANRKVGVYYGIATGFFIMLYTLWDSYAVKQLLIPPIFVEYVSHPFRILMLLPAVWSKKEETLALWQKERAKIMIIALMTPISFLLVLYALKISPVTFVAPAREMSIVFGVIFGAKLLTEDNFKSRMIGSIFIVVGIFLLAI
jgi:drug/metabolite transporter (DMT)-like permease